MAIRKSKSVLVWASAAFFFIFSTPLMAQTCATPAGDQVTYGINSWIGYAYQGANDYTNAHYFGSFTEPAIFNESFCGTNCAFAVNGCPVTTELFTVRFKMQMDLACGSYVFTIGADDGVRLSIDGGTTQLLNDYTTHGYRTTTATTTLADGTYSMILEYFEQNGGNQVSFSVAPAAGTNGPGVIAGSQTFCQAASFDPAPFTSTLPAVFCTGVLVYQWQQSPDQITWTNIPTATADTYDVPANSALGTIYYRRVATNGTQVIYSNTINVVNATPPGNPAVFGNNVWNAYVFNSVTAGTNYYGFYTENNLSFNTISRWGNAFSPSTANAASGLPWNGCAVAANSNYTLAFKRTNFVCGYYQIDIPYHDDNTVLYINGVSVFTHVGCCDAHTNVWTGFLGPTSLVDAEFTNFSGPGQFMINVALSATPPVTANTPTTVCATHSATLIATSAVAGVTYQWTSDINNPASTFTTPTTNASVDITPIASGNYTVTITDPVSGCTSSAVVPVTSASAATTAITSVPATLNTNCPGSSFVLRASGAAVYTWSADTGVAGGLSSTSGFQVTASPTQTTVYTVTGNTGCGSLNAQITITVNVPPFTTYGNDIWNVYGFNSTTIGTNYVGYYTENGVASGLNAYSFDTQSRWSSGASPATANASNGAAWVGCPMNATNISLSFKRTNFACGLYQLNLPAHDDDFLMYINGVQVAHHSPGCCDTHTNIWTGILNPQSQVELQLKQGGGGSVLIATFINLSIASGSTYWIGGVSTDWFNAANWCGGVPTSATNVVIPASGPQNMPVISGPGAECLDITISSGTAASTYTNLVAAATLTTAGSNNLDVYGAWINNGTLIPNTGSITLRGTSNTVSSSATETFYNLILNKTASNTVTISSGIHQISGTMTFTSGIVTQSATLKFLNGSSAAGANAASYVDGVVTKTGTNAFTFPVGKAGLYRPIGIGTSSTATDTYTANYFNTSPLGTYPNASRDVTLDHISNAEYWILLRTVGTSAVSNVTLSWDTNSGGVGNLANLRVAGWNSTTWKNLGNGGTTGTTTAGTVSTVAAVSTYGPFTLSSINKSNTLPVTLVDFTCAVNDANEVLLIWNTASEVNNDYFEVERSGNGSLFQSIHQKIKGAGTSAVAHRYSIVDATAPEGDLYYRLKQVDIDGAITYSEACVVHHAEGVAPIAAYPNPAGDVTYIDLNGRKLNTLAVSNALGVKVDAPYSSDDVRISINSANLASGMYVIRVVLDEKITTLKVLIAH